MIDQVFCTYLQNKCQAFSRYPQNKNYDILLVDFYIIHMNLKGYP